MLQPCHAQSAKNNCRATKSAERVEFIAASSRPCTGEPGTETDTNRDVALLGLCDSVSLETSLPLDVRGLEEASQELALETTSVNPLSTSAKDMLRHVYQPPCMQAHWKVGGVIVIVQDA